MGLPAAGADIGVAAAVAAGAVAAASGHCAATELADVDRDRGLPGPACPWGCGAAAAAAGVAAGPCRHAENMRRPAAVHPAAVAAAAAAAFSLMAAPSPQVPAVSAGRRANRRSAPAAPRVVRPAEASPSRLLALQGRCRARRVAHPPQKARPRCARALGTPDAWPAGCAGIWLHHSCVAAGAAVTPESCGAGASGEGCAAPEACRVWSAALLRRRLPSTTATAGCGCV